MKLEKNDIFYADKDSVYRKVQKLVTERFGWVDPTDSPFWSDRSPSEFNDNQKLLKIAIESHLHPKDKVLTVPSHEAFLNSHNIPLTSVYDISPSALRFWKPESQIYWCDVFSSAPLLELLSETSPQVMDLSNITEYAENDRKLLMQLAANLSSSTSLKTIMFTRIMETEHGSGLFAEILKTLNWNLTKYQEYYYSHENVQVATR